MMFFYNDTSTTEIYTLSLHDALPIYAKDGITVIEYEAAIIREAVSRALNGESLRSIAPDFNRRGNVNAQSAEWSGAGLRQDRKSTRLNSSHANISYAVFCLKTQTRTS